MRFLKRLTLDGEVFLDQLRVLFCGEQGGQPSNQQLHPHRPVLVLHDVEPSLIHLPQRHLHIARRHITTSGCIHHLFILYYGYDLTEALRRNDHKAH